MRRLRKTLFACTASIVLLGVVTFAKDARADVASWLFLGGGATQFKNSFTDTTLLPSMRLATGMGTDPSKKVIVGGLIRLDTLFGRGTDLSLVARTATYGFVNGNWGLALDLGGVARYWGTPNVYGGTGTLVLGAPWGVELELGAMLGTHDTRGVSAIIGVDLARLTVYRQSGSSWWKNTFPAVRTEPER